MMNPEKFLEKGVVARRRITSSRAERYVLVKDGVVINTCVWTGDEKDWKPPEGVIAIKSKEAQKGYLFDGKDFYKPEPEQVGKMIVGVNSANKLIEKLVLKNILTEDEAKELLE